MTKEKIVLGLLWLANVLLHLATGGMAKLQTIIANKIKELNSK